MGKLEKYMGRQIAHARTSAGVTAKALADALNIAETTLLSYEAGRERVPAEHLVDIKKLLNVSFDVIVPKEDNIVRKPID